MSEILVLKGKGNSGKSETIRTVFKDLKNKHPKALVNTIINDPVDMKIIMGIKGLKVGIENQGDPNSRLKKSLSDFLKANCDIIICATRTSGMTVQWVNSYSSQYNIHYIQQKYVSSNHSITNAQTAAQIITLSGL